MKCIILAAGYATRLYPLTKNMPKPLLEVGGITILEHILKKIEKIEDVDSIYIISNDKFYNHFNNWINNYNTNKFIKVLNDGTTSNDKRLGAIKDLLYVVDNENINDDILVLAGDNLFDFELVDFYNFFRNYKKDCLTTHELNDLNELKRTGVIEVDSKYKVTSFEEKPQNPKSNLAVPPFYIYTKETLPLIRQYINEGNNPDAPGMFIPWLIKHKDVYAYKFTGNRYDIGTLESYELVQKLFNS